jgi:hypothetical protein
MTRRLRENPNLPVRQAAALIPPAFAEGGPTAAKAPLCQNCALACGASTFLPVSVVITIEGANVAAPRWRRVARYETYSNNERMTAAPTPQGRTTMKSLNFLTHQEIFDRAVSHLDGQGRAALLPRGGGAYRGYCGGCPVGSFIKPRDYMTAMEGIPVRYIGKTPVEVPAYMDVGIAALKKALLRARINIYDPATVDLLSCLQNVHDVFGPWEWQDRLMSIARQFGVSAARVKNAA